MWCCSKQVTYPIVRQRRRPRLTATAQIVLSKANRRWEGKTAEILHKWRKLREERGLGLLHPAELLKIALKRVIDRWMFEDLLENVNNWRTIRHLVGLIGRSAAHQAASALNQWKATAHLRELTAFTHKRRIRTVIVAIRQKMAIEQRNSLSLWRKMAVKDRSFDVEAKRLSAIKLFLSLKAIFRRTLLSELLSKSNPKWALRRICKAFSKNVNTLLGKSVQLWRLEVDIGKNRHELGLNRRLAAISLRLRLQMREMHREALFRWKQNVPNLAFMRVNGAILPSRKAGKAGKVHQMSHIPLSPLASFTILAAFTKPISAISSLFRGFPLNIPQLDHISALDSSQIRLFKRIFALLSKNWRNKGKLALQEWALATETGRVQRYQYRHSARALGMVLKALAGKRIAVGFREMKVPKALQRVRKGIKALQRSYKYLLQKRFYRWNGSLKAFKAMYQLGALRLESALKETLKIRTFTHLKAVFERLNIEKHHIFLLNRILLKSLSRSVQLWHLKALETGLFTFQTALRLRRLHLLLSSRTRKDKGGSFAVLKGAVKTRELREKYLWKMGRLVRGQVERKVLWAWRGKARLLSRIVSGVRLIRRVSRRRSVVFFGLLSRVAKTSRGPI